MSDAAAWMARRYGPGVKADIHEIELEGDYKDRDGDPIMIPSVCATCSHCGHTTESFGTGEASIKRCLALLREECPKGEKNFYTE